MSGKRMRPNCEVQLGEAFLQVNLEPGDTEMGEVIKKWFVNKVDRMVNQPTTDGEEG